MIDGMDVEQVHFFKFFGVLVNDTLTWSDHIDMVCNKVTCSLNLLRRLSWFLPQPLLLYLKSYILPSFDYCDVVWSGCTRNEALRLETLLNFACHTVLRRRRDYSASSARGELGLSTLPQEESSTWPKPCLNVCILSLLLIFSTFLFTKLSLQHSFLFYLLTQSAFFKSLLRAKGFQFCWCFLVAVSSEEHQNMCRL